MKAAKVSNKSVDPIFEKIEKFSKLQRILIGGITFVVLIGAFVYFSYIPRHKEINQLESKQEMLAQKLNKAKINAQKINAYRIKMKEAEAEFKIARKALPEKKEIPSLLANISRSGQDSGLKFLLFQPEKENKKDFYAEIPISIKVIGNYHNVAIFFDRVSSLSRIVNIKNIRMVPRKENEKLLTVCTAMTYKFIEKPPEKKPPEKKKKKR
ncbi:MAG: type 4a pilus biogenesis protein PilO [Deltaproteobacteria bacterium]|nr:type 4a pilus biogenesis protein PilO [Deltaproteobacteria bacterium]